MFNRGESRRKGQPRAATHTKADLTAGFARLVMLRRRRAIEEGARRARGGTKQQEPKQSEATLTTEEPKHSEETLTATSICGVDYASPRLSRLATALGLSTALPKKLLNNKFKNIGGYPTAYLLP